MNEALLVERTGWTLDYIRGMDLFDQQRLLAVFDGLDKARAHVQQREASKAKRKK